MKQQYIIGEKYKITSVSKDSMWYENFKAGDFKNGVILTEIGGYKTCWRFTPVKPSNFTDIVISDCKIVKFK